MKKTIFFLILLSIISCQNEVVKASYEIEMKYYWNVKIPKFDKVKVTEYIDNDVSRFTYEYKNFHDGIDTLLIKNDSLFINSISAKFISKKNFIQNGKSIEVRKYYYTNGHPHSFANYYVNKEKGIVLAEIGDHIICEYLQVKNRKLLKSIMKDKTFFYFELTR